MIEEIGEPSLLVGRVVSAHHVQVDLTLENDCMNIHARLIRDLQSKADMRRRRKPNRLSVFNCEIQIGHFASASIENYLRVPIQPVHPIFLSSEFE